AFVFFFQMLYPFRAVNDDRAATAGAAGGCVLLRRDALVRAGGLAAIKGSLIDDCALAKAIKTTGGRLWLGLGENSHSLRAADGLGALWAMVRRSAFTQLHHSYAVLLGTSIGLLLIFVAPPLLFLTCYWHSQVPAAAMAGAAWALMGLAYQPTLRAYDLPAWVGFTLPITAALYGAMTVDSGLAYWRGQGGAWKGRHYDSLATPPDIHK
ncbi:MAG: glycosyl transferase family 2, partial [Rhodospirillaceae bacterium]